MKNNISSECLFGEPADIDQWMDLVRLVRNNFPGLETEESLEEHRHTVLKFFGKQQALCVKDGNRIAGVLLFSRNRNMICCLAVHPEYRRKGIASMLLEKALKRVVCQDHGFSPLRTIMSSNSSVMVFRF